MQRPVVLRDSPLLASRVVAVSARESDSDSADLLRELLSEAVEALRGDPRRSKLYEAVGTTYMQRVRTQETAARRLGLLFSTYRRHLVQGTGQVCEHLWGRETALAAMERLPTD